MSAKIPTIVRDRVSDRAAKALDIVAKFVEEECIPADPVFEAQLGRGPQRFTTYPTIIDNLKRRARSLGLWNLFIPKGAEFHPPPSDSPHYRKNDDGHHHRHRSSHSQLLPGFTNLEYALMAEHLGRSRVASEACNCSAPDTGNMEVLGRFGSDDQRARWLAPLLEGEIRSAFLMTEPDIASSDARNIRFSIRRDGDEYILNGQVCCPLLDTETSDSTVNGDRQKWWSSGAGDPRCKLYVLMGKTDPDHPDPYQQQSVILVPADSDGITIHRMLSVYGYDDAPHGHGQISFKNVRVPVGNLVLGEGRGFEIIQGRLGPGRIHHAMRTIGAAERALDWMLMRINDPNKTPFGKMLREHAVIMSWVAESRLEIDAARLVVLNAAVAIDTVGPKAALGEIAQAKVLAPRAALSVIDQAAQAFGAAGVSQDTPLAAMWAGIRTLRLADGPDEVHLQQMGRLENRRGLQVSKTIEKQVEETERLLARYGVQRLGFADEFGPSKL